MTTEERTEAVERPAPRPVYVLIPKQGMAMDAFWLDDVNQVLYGGAAGGGKSGFLRAMAYHLSQVWPGAHIAIFRTDYTQLKKTQVYRWWGEMARIGYDTKKHWLETAGEWHFTNPYAPPNAPDPRAFDTVVEFLHLDKSIGAEKWLSAEFAFIEIDESTQMSEDDLSLLYSRVRVATCKDCDDLLDETGDKFLFCTRHTDANYYDLEQKQLWRRLANEREEQARAGGVTNPDDIKRIRSDWRPGAVYATNPGSESHAYHMQKFVLPSRANDGKAWTVTEKVLLPGIGEMEVTTKRQFIPSFLSDNRYINPAEYAATLVHLPRRRQEQLLSGNWDYFEGQVFDMLREDIHLIDARWLFGRTGIPPADWPRLAGLDHGTVAPTTCEWVTRDDDSGSLIIGYLEYYSPGANAQHIQGIKDLAMRDGRPDINIIADPQMYRKRQGHDRVWSVADEFAYGGEPPENVQDAQLALRNGLRLIQATVDNITSRMVMQRMFECDPDRVFPGWHPKAGQHGAPQAYICLQAPNLWRELPLIKYVDGSEETVKLDDHAYDGAKRAAVAFEQALLSSRGQQRITQVRYA